MNRVPAPDAQREAKKESATALFGRAARMVALALCCLVLAAPASQAQNVGGLPGFLQHLFGLGAQPAPPMAPNAALKERAHRPVRKKQDFVSSTATRAPGTPGGAPVQPTFFVSVLGDSLAILASQGLTDAFAARPEVSVTDLARDVSGLARDDYFDWPKAARDLLATKPKLDLAVIMLGINDVQPLKDNGEMVDTLSDKWRDAYALRVDALLAPFQDAHIPVLWVGLPPMRDEPLHTQALALNEIYPRPRRQGRRNLRRHLGRFLRSGRPVRRLRTRRRRPERQIAQRTGRDLFHQGWIAKGGAGARAGHPARDRQGQAAGQSAALPPDIEKEASAINEEIQREKGGDGRPGEAAVAARETVGRADRLADRPARVARRRSGQRGRRSLASRRGATGFRLPAGAPAGRADNFSWPPPRSQGLRGVALTACLAPTGVLGDAAHQFRSARHAASGGRSGVADEGARDDGRRSGNGAEAPAGGPKVHGAGAVYQGPVVREPERAAHARSAADRAQSLGPDQRQRPAARPDRLTRSA